MTITSGCAVTNLLVAGTSEEVFQRFTEHGQGVVPHSGTVSKSEFGGFMAGCIGCVVLLRESEKVTPQWHVAFKTR